MRVLLLLVCFLFMASCTLTPRTSRGRTLSPDREEGTPDHWPQDTVPADSVAPAVH